MQINPVLKINLFYNQKHKFKNNSVLWEVWQKRGLIMPGNKVYKDLLTCNIRMFPSDPKGSLDDYIFSNNIGGVFNGRYISFYR